MSSVQIYQAVVALHDQENCNEETSDVHFVSRLPLACKQSGEGQYPSVSAPAQHQDSVSAGNNTTRCFVPDNQAMRPMWQQAQKDRTRKTGTEVSREKITNKVIHSCRPQLEG